MTPLLLTLVLAQPPGYGPPPPPIVFPPPIFVPPAAPPPPVPTVKEFAATFRPTPGHHKVLILHPNTRQPVEVCFELPPGCPKKVFADRTEIDFRYGRYEVQVHFRRNGRVDVKYED